MIVTATGLFPSLSLPVARTLPVPELKQHEFLLPVGKVYCRLAVGGQYTPHHIEQGYFAQFRTIAYT